MYAKLLGCFWVITIKELIDEQIFQSQITPKHFKIENIVLKKPLLIFSIVLVTTIFYPQRCKDI
jgi:hypothetical protein